MRPPVSLALLVLAACSEQKVGAFNGAPSAAVLSPADGSTVAEGAAVELRGSASDPDDASAALSVTWYVNDVVACSGTAADDGTTTCSITAGADTMTVRLEVADPDGAAASASVTVNVTPTAAPDAQIESPLASDALTTDVPVLLRGVVDDAEDAAEALSCTWTSSVDGPLGGALTPFSDGSIESYATLTAGDHVLTLTVTDSSGKSGGDTVAVHVDPPDEPPTAPTVTLSPDPATSVDDLVATVTADSVDPEGAAVSYTYEWLVDGSPSGASTGPTLPASATTRGELWTVRVTPTADGQAGPPGEASLTIDNAAPSLTGVAITPDPATVEDTLTCVPSGWSDPDGDADASTFAWTVNGSAAGSGTTLSSGFTRGDLVECTVTPFDGDLTGPPRSASVLIDNAAPSMISVTLTPSSPTTTSTLTASASATDPDGDAVSIRYDWYVNGALASTGADTLSGATSFDRGDRVYVTATPSDGTASGAAMSSATVTVGNTAPAAPTVSIVPSAPEEGVDDLVCVVDTASTDADGDAVTYTMRWTRGGAPWTGALSSSTWTDDTVSGADTTAGETWTCTATPDDGTDDGATASASVTIEASAATDYTDTWTLDRTVSYRCAGGAVDFSFTSVQVFDTNPDITVVGGGNVAAMTGTFSSDVDFYADNVLTGTCTETYAIDATFLDANTFEGTITASYAGGVWCVDCRAQSWTVTGTR